MSPKRGDCLSVEVERLSGGVFATTHVYECLKIPIFPNTCIFAYGNCLGLVCYA